MSLVALLLDTFDEQWHLLTGIGLFLPAGRYISHPIQLFFQGGPHNLYNSCGYGLEGFLSMRNDTFVDSELFNYTGQTTPLLQLSNPSSLSENSSRVTRTIWAVGNLVVRASDSRPEGLEIVEVEIEVVSSSIVPSGNFAELNHTVTCMVLKANDRRTSSPCHDEFRGPRSDYVRQVALETTTTEP
ncbi:hypothetical protein TNCV_610891 [Trichonephila clavipes]|nr:hypothetical protein TNCV_610891 [Trichonephila clavipes]